MNHDPVKAACKEIGLDPKKSVLLSNNIGKNILLEISDFIKNKNIVIGNNDTFRKLSQIRKMIFSLNLSNLYKEFLYEKYCYKLVEKYNKKYGLIETEPYPIVKPKKEK